MTAGSIRSFWGSAADAVNETTQEEKSTSRDAEKRTDVEVEGGGCVQDHVDAGRLHDFVKGALLGNVRYNSGLQLILAKVGVGIVDFLCLVLRANRCYDRVAAGEQRLQDMS